jgi:hypothetical protein
LSGRAAAKCGSPPVQQSAGPYARLEAQPAARGRIRQRRDDKPGENQHDSWQRDRYCLGSANGRENQADQRDEHQYHAGSRAPRRTD